MTARHPNDAYLTPPCAAIALGRWLRSAPGFIPHHILDPFAGAGSLLRWAGDECSDLRFDYLFARPGGIPKPLGQGRLWRLAKPDGDNVKKAICDALVEGGVIRDDKICARKLVDSFIAAEGEAPHTRVRLEELDPLPLIPWPEKPRAKPVRAERPTLL